MLEENSRNFHAVILLRYGMLLQLNGFQLRFEANKGTNDQRMLVRVLFMMPFFIAFYRIYRDK